YEFLPMDGLVNLARLCFIDCENIHYILHVCIAQSLQVRKAGFYQCERLFFTNGQRASKGLRCLRHLLFYHGRRGCVLADIDLPASQSRSQPRVLPFFPDCERKLIFIHGNLHAFLLSIENEVLYLCRLKRFQNVFLWIGAPADDIDLFVIQLADDGFDAGAAHANTRAHGIHFFVRAPDCDLGAITCFSRDAANLHGAVRDFAYFQLEKSAHKIGMATRHDNLGAADTVFHGDDVRAKPVAHVVIFYYHSLALRHDGLKFSKIENDIGTIETPHRSTDDFARAIFEFLVDHFFLGLANPLHHRLFCRLRRDASKILRCHFHFDGVADLRIRLDLARFQQIDFILRIRDFVDYQEVSQCSDFPRLRIDVDTQIARSTHTLLGG